VHARSLATRFSLQIRLRLALNMRRETSRVSFLMCPFCVRAPSSDLATAPLDDARHDVRRDTPVERDYTGRRDSNFATSGAKATGRQGRPHV
jgi:hypothetical protein